MVTNNNRKLANKAKQGIQGNMSVPRNRLRVPKMDRGGSIIRSRFVQFTAITAAAAQVTGAFGVVPALNPSNDPGNAVIKNYQEYRIKSSKLTYTPQIGSTTPGIVYIGYYDNPEIIYRAYGGLLTPANILALAQTAPQSVSAPVWQSVELTAGTRQRRKMYSVDSNSPVDSVSADQCIHGIYFCATVGAPFSTTIGILSQEYVAEGFGLQNIAFSGI